MTAGKNHLKYYSQLDGLRCFAVLAVMVGHWIAWDANTVLVRNIPWGHGVILFFVLSGYLISNILFGLKEKLDNGEKKLSQALKTFYTRRFLRIFPAYYLLVFYLMYLNYENTREVAPWLLSYTSNILQCITGNYVGDFNHFWSLAVEEQFYIIWPLIILLVPSKNSLKVILLFMLGSFLSRAACYFIFKDNWMVAAYFTPNLFFPLCLGAVLAYSKRYREKWHQFFNSYGLMIGSIVFYILFYYFAAIVFKISFLVGIMDEYLFAIVCVFIIARASENGFKLVANFVLTHEAVVFMGKISYGLYLYHHFMIRFFWEYLAPSQGISVHNKKMVWFMYLLATFLISVFSYYVIEKPSNSLKRFFKY